MIRIHHVALFALTLGAADTAAQPSAGERADAGAEPNVAVPRFFHDPSIGLRRPDRLDLVNQNGTPRVHTDEDYAEFWRRVAPELRSWATDPRLDLNPAYVAALLAKESGFQPLATSWSPANGYAQLTHIADADMRQIARDSPRWNWMGEELERWPRHPTVHRPDARKPVTDSLTAAGIVHGGNEYFFDPVLATRGAVFWLRLLAEVWTAEEYPGRYASLARDRLSGGRPISEQDLLELVTVSYNRGYTYVEDLVRRHGRNWLLHVNDEAADHLERIRTYTVHFQQ